MAKMAEVLGVSMDYLLGKETGGEPEDAAPESEDINNVPLVELLRRIGARPTGTRAEEDIAASAGTRRGARSRIPQGYDEARRRKLLEEVEGEQEVEVEGRCMEDRLYPGDAVIFDTRLMPNIGDIIVGIRFNEMLIKYLRLKGDRQYLEAHNGEVLPLDQYIRILGPVTWIKKRIR